MVPLSIALAALIILGSRSVSALDPSLDVSQYAHTAWRIRDGFTRGKITAIAQTPDGYLWLGTEFGLLRFDGVQVVPWQPAGERLLASYINSLLVARDGTLWIGTRKGLASMKEGKLTQYPELSGHRVLCSLQGRDGTVWLGTVGPGRLCAVQPGKVQCQGEANFGLGVTALHEDRQGNLWVAATTGLWRWKPTPPTQYSFPLGTVAADDLIEDEGGGLLLAANGGGMKRFDGDKIRSEPMPGVHEASRPTSFLRSSDGSLWIGMLNGLVHLRQGKADAFGVADGLSGEFINRMYEDRERNIWVGTSGGLDRFREYTFPSISANQGLSSSVAWAVQATPDGSIWIAASDGLNRWRDGSVTFYGKQAGGSAGQRKAASNHRAVPLLETNARSLGVDEKGRLWAAIKDEVLYYAGDRFVRVPGLPGGNIWSIAPDGRGNTWLSNGNMGLFYSTGGGAVQQVPWARFGGEKLGSSALLPDPLRGGLWVGLLSGGVDYFDDGRILASYTAADGLGSGEVVHLRFDGQRTLWAATEGGLSRIRDGHVLTLTANNGLPCDHVHWSIEDESHSIWLYMPCGLVRVAHSELEAWVKSPTRRIEVTVFDASDGARTVGATGYGPRVTKAPDGRIWFATDGGVTMINPRHLPHNDVPPPVHIEQITADGKAYVASAPGSGRLRLPPRVRDIAIDYTALSLAVPEKVRFRVKLEGQDNEWRELVNERHVHYTNLSPKDYQFRVKAANNSGIWNEEGASLDFTILPAFYQTAWFRGFCAAAAVALLWGGHRIRVGVLERRQRLLEQHQRVLEQHQTEITMLNERLMKAQEEERTRIAGELHDGILQQLTGANLTLGVAKLQIPRDSPARTEIINVETLLMEIGTDIRQLSHELHPAVLQNDGLPKALSSYCKEFSKTRDIPVSCDADPEVKELSRGAALALFRIAQEALGNVAKHSKAKKVDVRLARADSTVRLTVSDDGIGFVPGRARDSGGVGLVNMRERLHHLKGTLELESQPGRGTTIRAEVPFRPA